MEKGADHGIVQFALLIFTYIKPGIGLMAPNDPPSPLDTY
jgi:hypothetical protein